MASFANLARQATAGISRGNASSRLRSASSATAKRSMTDLAKSINSPEYKVRSMVNDYFKGSYRR